MKTHEKTVVLWLTANSPITHVMPNRGSNTIVLLTDVLQENVLAYVHTLINAQNVEKLTQ